MFIWLGAVFILIGVTMPHERRAEGGDLYEEIRSLDSKVRIIAQRLMIIEKNEQIIGKTLITHNKNIKEMAEKGISAAPPANGGSADLNSLRELLDQARKQAFDNDKRLGAIEEALSEIKYVVDNLNPVEYVTISQLQELLDERLKPKS